MPIKSRSVSGVAMCPQMKLGKNATARRDDLDGPDRLSIYEYMYVLVWAVQQRSSWRAVLQMQFVIALLRCAHIIMVKCLSSVMDLKMRCSAPRKRSHRCWDSGRRRRWSLIKCANCVRFPKEFKRWQRSGSRYARAGLGGTGRGRRTGGVRWKLAALRLPGGQFCGSLL